MLCVFSNLPSCGHTTSTNGSTWLHSKTELESSARCLQTLRCWCVCRSRTCSSLIPFHVRRVCCHTLSLPRAHSETRGLARFSLHLRLFIAFSFIADVQSRRCDIVHADNAAEICTTRMVNYVSGRVFSFWGAENMSFFFFFCRAVPCTDKRLCGRID